MKTVAYLIEDVNLGGVTRTLASQIARLEPHFRIEQHAINADHPLPPHLDADAVVIHYTSAWTKLPFLTLLRAQRHRRPIVLVEHMYTEAFERLCVPNVARFRLMLRLTYRLADVVVAVSEGQAQWMLRAGLLPSDKLRVIASASDCSHLFDVPPPSFDGQRALRLAAFGRYSYQKGYDILIEAMRHVDPRIATLTLAGYGEDEQKLRAAARGLPHVEIGASIKDLASFLTACDAVVVPSRWEAFGLVCAEARSAARPVIVAGLDGLNEQVSRETGFAVNPEDPEALADAIRQLHRCDLTAMGGAARASALRHFETHVQGWRELLDGVDGGAAPALRNLAPALR